ncbi:MAG: XRE family transcriptional regulator [Eubacteriales bacterium]|nr:XRE family transcriptional regulator [Eubacteriales bacterium]
MTEQIKQVSARIRELREIAGLTPQSLAAEMSIPPETYLAYESGDSDIPVSFLYEFSTKFKVELSSILTGEDPRLRSFSVVRRDMGAGVERRREYKYKSLAWNFANKNAEPFMVTVEPVPEDAPVSYNSHPGQEFNYVVEGSLKVYINTHEIILEEGDSLYFDSGLKHGMKAGGSKRAAFIAVITGD